MSRFIDKRGTDSGGYIRVDGVKANACIAYSTKGTQRSTSMTYSDNTQLYSDVEHCVEVLVDRITDEIAESVADLVLDGRIDLEAFFERHGMEHDSCDQHVFFSSYQRDIVRRVERGLRRKGYVCKLTVSERSIRYSTRVPHPLKKLVTWAGLVILPLLAGTGAAVHYRCSNVTGPAASAANIHTPGATSLLWREKNAVGFWPGEERWAKVADLDMNEVHR